jgi:imidazolonepropionase-like amidohydrolase
MAQWALNSEEWSQLKQEFAVCGEMVRHFHAQGVLLTAGSDLGGWMTPGVSLHRELELLVATGISPMDAIRIGTSNGARALGISDQVGTLEQGMLADILILRENPLVDIRNTLTIELVLQGGLILDPGKLLSGTQAPQ